MKNAGKAIAARNWTLNSIQCRGYACENVVITSAHAVRCGG